MYRGEHHPTDVLGSLILAALWLTATYVLIRPNADPGTRVRPHIRHTPRAGRRKVAAAAARG